MLLQFICSGVGGMMEVLYSVMCVRRYVCGCRVQGGGECIYITKSVSCVTLKNIQYLTSLQPH